MSDALEALKRWISDSPRRAIAAGCGAVALLGLALALSMGGDDVAPVVGAGATETPAVTGTPAATGEAPADGTVVAGAGAGAPAAGPNAASSGSSGGGGGASASSIEIAQETEKAMNVGLPEGRLTPELGEPVATSDAVASTGAKLEKLAEAYSDCLRSAKDYYDCLDELKGAKTERIYDSKPYGALVSMKTSGGTVVRLSIRGDALCRMFKPGTTCDAWSSVG